MTTTSSLEPNRLRFKLWAVQVMSVAMMTGLAWWLPELVQPTPAPKVALGLVIVAVAVVPITVLLARLFGIGAREGTGYGTHPVALRPAALATSKPVAGGLDLALGRYIGIIGLAELPAVLGVVHVLLGGPRPNALMLGVASAILLVLYRPSQRPNGTQGRAHQP